MRALIDLGISQGLSVIKQNRIRNSGVYFDLFGSSPGGMHIVVPGDATYTPLPVITYSLRKTASF